MLNNTRQNVLIKKRIYVNVIDAGCTFFSHLVGFFITEIIPLPSHEISPISVNEFPLP